MGENSKIEWCDNTFSSEWLRRRPELQPVGVHQLVATFAEGDAVPHVEAKVCVLREAADVMCMKVAAPIIATVAARKAISRVNVIAPALERGARSKATTLDTLPINVARGIFATRRPFPRLCTDQRARLGAVLDAKSIAWARLRCRAHLCPTFL